MISAPHFLWKVWVTSQPPTPTSFCLLQAQLRKAYVLDKRNTEDEEALTLSKPLALCPQKLIKPSDSYYSLIVEPCNTPLVQED